MSGRLKLITAPTSEPITLIEARAHLRIDATGSPLSHPEDTKINSLIKAARQHLDGRYGMLARQLMPATWELILDEFPSNEIRIPLPPLVSVTSVKYDDIKGVEQTVNVNDYVLDIVSEPGWITPVSTVSWPSTMETLNAVRVRFLAGYANAASIPETIKEAMLLLIGTWFENRESVSMVNLQKVPDAVESLLSPYQIWMFT